MTQFDIEYNGMGLPEGSISLVANDGRRWEIPENTACICFDSDGEFYAYESGDVEINKHGAWIDKAVDGFCVKVGKVHHAEVSDSWRQPIWLKSEPKKKPKVDAVPAIAIPEEKPKADGRKLRGLVIDSLTRDVQAEVIGSRVAIGIARDLDEMCFTGYTTLKLVLAFALAGYDIRQTGVMRSLETIDHKVNEAWSK